MKKRIVSGIMCLAMLLSLLPVSAFALPGDTAAPKIAAYGYSGTTADGKNDQIAVATAVNWPTAVNPNADYYPQNFWVVLDNWAEYDGWNYGIWAQPLKDASGNDIVSDTTNGGKTVLTSDTDTLLLMDGRNFTMAGSMDGSMYSTDLQTCKSFRFALTPYKVNGSDYTLGDTTNLTWYTIERTDANQYWLVNDVKLDEKVAALDKLAATNASSKHIQYKVSFAAGEGATGTIAPQYVNVGESFTPPKSGFTKTDYTLSGWKNGAADWTNTSKVTEPITLTAQWTANAVTPSEKADPTISNAGPVALAGTGAKSADITVTAGEGATITAASANPKVATAAVANDGKVTITAVAAGSTKVTVNSTETATHKAGRFELTVNVTNLGVTVAGATSETPFPGGDQALTASSIQSEITPAAPSGTVIKVTGASNYITGWTDFSSVPGQENGHYVLLKFTRDDSEDIFIESPTEGNLKKAVDWNDGLLLIRLENTNNWKCKFVVGEAKANAANECDTTKPHTEYTLDFTAVVREPAAIASVSETDPKINVSYANGTASFSGILEDSDFTDGKREVTLSVIVNENDPEDVVVTISKDADGKLTAAKKDWNKVGGLDLAIDISGLVMEDPEATAEGGVAKPTTTTDDELLRDPTKGTAATAANTAISDAAAVTPPIDNEVLNAVADKIANETKIDTVAVVATDDVKNQLATDGATNLATVKGLVDDVKNAATPEAKTAAEEALTSGTKQVVLVSQEIAVVDVEPTVGAAPATLTIDITPVATTVLVGKSVATGDIKVLADDASNAAAANAVVIKESEPVTIDTPTDVTLTLPSGYVNGRYTIEHKKGSTSYWYEGAVSSDVLRFTSTHGFSEFVIYATSPCEAKIGDTLYKTFTEAVNKVKDGETIELLKALDTTKLPVTVSGNTSKTFVIDAAKFTSFRAGDIRAADNITITNSGTTFTVTYAVADEPDTPPTPVNPGNGGGGGGVSGNVTTNPTTNGKVSISPSAPSKGATVTINLTPNTGYEVGTVTVKDANGNAMNVTKVNDTTYTFVMPDGKVSVDATFTQVQQPSDEPFVDVSASDYFYDAVKWAVEKGITTGDGVNTFGPNKSCTRAQMVTFLWRAAGSPAATGSNPFADVPAGEYYTDAVLWAVSQGITNGTGADSFSPNATVSRGQTVTFLYRYAGSPSVNAGDAFNDVAATDYYANAVQWAVNNGITNGTGNGTFSPVNDCTRGQIVTFMYRQMAE